MADSAEKTLPLADNTTVGIGQKAATLHPITRPFSALVMEDKMGGLLSDA